jgi:hypothetical protein
MVDYVELSVDEMLLDQDNPRLGSASSQSEALQRLIELNPSHFRKMMQSIKDNGLDPGDSLYVMAGETEEDFIVLEGNRRLSALKVLTRPDLLDGTAISETVKKLLVSIVTGFDRTKVEPIRCALFEKRDDADGWIYRRHTGAADGEGRINWGPLEIQRFLGDRSVLDVIEFVGRNADYTPEQWASTKEVIESKKSTNLSRLLESAYGQKHLGLSVSQVGDEKIPLLSSEPKWALSVLQKLIEDVRDSVVDSRNLNTASEIEKYFKNLPPELQPSAKTSAAPKAFKDINLKGGASVPAKPTAVPKPKTTVSPRMRATLAPKKHPFKAPTNDKGRRLLMEAGKIDANIFTVSSAFVLRAFIELAVEEYMTANSIPKVEVKSGKPTDLDASQRADRVAKDIVGKGTFQSSDLRPFHSSIVNKPSPTSIQSLNGFVHSKFATPTPDALRAGWDAAVPVFIATYGAP